MKYISKKLCFVDCAQLLPFTTSIVKEIGSEGYGIFDSKIVGKL